MQSFIIASKDKNKRENYALGICKKNKVDDFDITTILYEKTIGIEEIRILQKKLSLKPMRGAVKAAIIKDAENLTTAAQNSLLKLLEEPPAQTIILLTVSQKDFLLPTIRSRCVIIELKDETLNLSAKDLSYLLNILSSFSSASIGERLKLAQDVSKTKEEAALWLEKMIMAARYGILKLCSASQPRFNRSQPLTSASSPKLWPGLRRHFGEGGSVGDNPQLSQYLKILISSQRFYTILKTTNVNPRFTLETLFLNL